MFGCPCCACGPVRAFEGDGVRGYRCGPQRLSFWPRSWGNYGPTQAERKSSLEALKKHLEEQLAEVTKELGSL